MQKSLEENLQGMSSEMSKVWTPNDGCKFPKFKFGILIEEIIEEVEVHSIWWSTWRRFSVKAFH